jgi:hypothetical protein
MNDKEESDDELDSPKRNNFAVRFGTGDLGTGPNNEILKEKINWDAVAHNDLPAWRQWVRIFTPFSYMRRKRYQSDAFYYPQSFMAGVLISFVSVAYMSITCFNYMEEFKLTVQKKYANVYDTMFSFFRNGNKELLNMNKIEIDLNMIDPFTAKL